jgi:hypothetical protein
MVFQIAYLLVEDIPGSSRFLREGNFYLLFFFVASEKAIFKTLFW